MGRRRLCSHHWASNQLMGFVPLHSLSYKMTFAAYSPPVFKPAKAFKEKEN